MEPEGKDTESGRRVPEGSAGPGPDLAAGFPGRGVLSGAKQGSEALESLDPEFRGASFETVAAPTSLVGPVADLDPYGAEPLVFDEEGSCIQTPVSGSEKLRGGSGAPGQMDAGGGRGFPGTGGGEGGGSIRGRTGFRRRAEKEAHEGSGEAEGEQEGQGERETGKGGCARISRGAEFPGEGGEEARGLLGAKGGGGGSPLEMGARPRAARLVGVPAESEVLDRGEGQAVLDAGEAGDLAQVERQPLEARSAGPDLDEVRREVPIEPRPRDLHRESMEPGPFPAEEEAPGQVPQSFEAEFACPLAGIGSGQTKSEEGGEMGFEKAAKGLAVAPAGPAQQCGFGMIVEGEHRRLQGEEEGFSGPGSVQSPAFLASQVI